VRRRIVIFSLILLTVIAALLATSWGRNRMWSVFSRFRGRHTVAERLDQYGDAAKSRLLPQFEAAGVDFPPRAVRLVAIKDQRKLQVYASGDDLKFKFITEYAVKGQSGRLGPKLREGDCQVPEGRYDIESLNPNSRFHLSLRLNYPNEFDKTMGRKDCRENLGSDIMIHGGSASIGCLAMGDPVAEELFVLVAETGHANSTILVTPVDFRKRPQWKIPVGLAHWVPDLYAELRLELQRLPAPAHD
jgi:hypothetical protein